MSLPRFAPCVGRCFLDLGTGPPWQMGPDFVQKEPELAPNLVIIPSKCNRHRPNFMPMQPKFLPNSPELHANATHFYHDVGQYSIDMQPKPSEFQANIGGGTADKKGCVSGGGPHMGGVGVEEVHTWRAQVWRRSTRGGH